MAPGLPRQHRPTAPRAPQAPAEATARASLLLGAVAAVVGGLALPWLVVGSRASGLPEAAAAGVALRAYELPPAGQIAAALAVVLLAHAAALAARSARPGLSRATAWLTTTLAAWLALPLLAPALLLTPPAPPGWPPPGDPALAATPLSTTLGSGWYVAAAGLLLLAAGLLASRRRGGARAPGRERETVAASLVAGLVVQVGLLATAVHMQGPPPDHPAAILAPPQVPPAPTRQPAHAPPTATSPPVANSPTSTSTAASTTSRPVPPSTAVTAALATGQASAAPASRRRPRAVARPPRHRRRVGGAARQGSAPARHGLPRLLDAASRGGDAVTAVLGGAEGRPAAGLRALDEAGGAGGWASLGEAAPEPPKRGPARAATALCGPEAQARLRRALAEAAFTCSVPALGVSARGPGAPRKAPSRLWVRWALEGQGLPEGEPALVDAPGLDAETRRCVVRALGILRWDTDGAPRRRCRLEVSVPVPQHPKAQAGWRHSASGRS